MEVNTQLEELGGDTLETSERDIFDTRYYVINKKLLCLHGQWPYQTLRDKLWRLILTVVFAITFLLPMFVKVVKSRKNTALFTECIACAITSVGCVAKLANTFIAAKKLKAILDEIRRDWSTTEVDEEKTILKGSAEQGRLVTISYLFVMSSAMFLWILTPFIPRVMDWYAPLNESRPRIVIYQMDYKAVFNIDQDVHHHMAHFHGAVTCIYGITMLVAVDTLYMVISLHICGMFRILRNRLESLWNTNEKANIDLFKVDRQDDPNYQGIIDCMKLHKRILVSVRNMEASNEWFLIVVLSFSMAITPCVGAQAVNPKTSRQDALRFVMFGIAAITHLFCNTLPGHWISSESALIRDSSCRGLIVIALRRTATPCTIAAGKVWIMSMENFCSVVKTIMSYLTMLTSFQ